MTILLSRVVGAGLRLVVIHALKSDNLLVNASSILLVQQSMLLHGTLEGAILMLLRVRCSGSHWLLSCVSEVDLTETLTSNIVLHRLLLDCLQLFFAKASHLRSTVLLEKDKSGRQSCWVMEMLLWFHLNVFRLLSSTRNVRLHESLYTPVLRAYKWSLHAMTDQIISRLGVVRNTSTTTNTIDGCTCWLTLIRLLIKHLVSLVPWICLHQFIRKIVQVKAVLKWLVASA